MQKKWHHNLANFKVSNKYYPWLARPKSLSSLMRSYCNQLRVKLLSQNLSVMQQDEVELLQVTDNQGLLREVFLQADGEYWSYGRVVAPMNTYYRYQDIFDSLGEQLIGESWLYQESQVRRSEFEYARLDALDCRTKSINQWYVKEDLAEVYARRSVFTLNSYQLLVMEAYLPEIPLLN